MRGVKVLLKYILGILLKGREIVNHSTIQIFPCLGSLLELLVFFFNINLDYTLNLNDSLMKKGMFCFQSVLIFEILSNK